MLQARSDGIFNITKLEMSHKRACVLCGQHAEKHLHKITE